MITNAIFYFGRVFLQLYFTLIFQNVEEIFRKVIAQMESQDGIGGDDAKKCIVM